MRCVRGIGITGLVLVLLMSATVAAEEVASSKQADWRQLAKLVLEFKSEYDSQGRFTNNGGRYMDGYVAWKAAFVPFWKDFAKRYGTTWEEIEPKFQGVEKPKGVPQKMKYLVWSVSRIDLERHEKQLAGWAEQYAESQRRSWKRLFDQDHENVEVMMRQADRVVGFLKIAQKLNARGDYAAALRTAEEAVEKTLPKYKSHLAGKKWPAHNASYKGVDKPEALAKAALEFLRKNPKWTAPEYNDSHTPVAAVVAGSEWTVYKRQPITNLPMQHSVKVLVAFTGEKHADLAYCYFMEFYTSEGLGVKPSLPFHYANSRQFECYRMLRANLPK